MRARWQKIAVIGCLLLAAASLVFAISLMFMSPGPGEVSVVLHGAFMVMGLNLTVVFVGMAIWIWLWNVRWLRWVGIACVSMLVIWAASTYAAAVLNDREDQRAVESTENSINEIGDRYLVRLTEEAPETAFLARGLYQDFLQEQRAVSKPSGSLVFGGLEFRAVWFLYYWTFFDPDFAGFTTFYPGQDDCAAFTEAFGAKYNEIAPVPVFVELCETP